MSPEARAVRVALGVNTRRTADQLRRETGLCYEAIELALAELERCLAIYTPPVRLRRTSVPPYGFIFDQWEIVPVATAP